MSWALPTSVCVAGREYEIRSDYRAVLDICAALSDVELDGRERAIALLEIFYPRIEEMPAEAYEEAIRRCFEFINLGNEETRPKGAPKLMDWEQDFPYIVAPINRVAGCEIRSIPYLHWWTFVSYYYEIGGDCLFAQVVQIRDKLRRGKPLDKTEREWYRKNRQLVDFKQRYTEADDLLIRQWTTQGGEKL